MTFDERALHFSCHDAALFGVLSAPATASARGVLIIVGGPQYRAGSHRQFTLLARSLAQRGIPAMRFDYRGMGDSEGSVRDFEAVGDDLRAAIDQFFSAVPGIEEVVLWGLCDAASAALLYAGGDRRVCGLVLLNPWVRTEHGIARTTLKHYYFRRLLEAALWRKIVQGKFNLAHAAGGFVRLVRAALLRPSTRQGGGAAATAALPERMCAGLHQFGGKVLLILSGADLTAREFSGLAAGSRRWRRLLGAPRVTLHQLAKADHTFSRRAWRDQVADWTGEWIVSW